MRPGGSVTTLRAHTMDTDSLATAPRDAGQMRVLLADADTATGWLASLGLIDTRAAHANLVRMQRAGVPHDLMATVAQQFAAAAPQLADPDMALSNLERFLSAARSPMSTAALFERDVQTLPDLLQLFSTSQFLSDLLVADGEAFDLLRMTGGLPVARDELVGELVAEVRAVGDDGDVQAALRRAKRRETLRIAFGDIVRSQPLNTVARQISYLADAMLEAALDHALRRHAGKNGQPIGRSGQPAKFVVLALGKLGGMELNYSSDIDLVLVYSDEGKTDGQHSISNQDYYTRVGRDLVRLLGEQTALGTAYRVDLRLRPEGSRGEICLSFDRTLAYYDVKGRTWERQAYIKARPVAGDHQLGHQLLERLEPWVYRRYLSRADITGIRSLKQRIERRAQAEGVDERNVKTGHGGIRDIEFVIQFLQLLNGGSLPEIRTGNTLEAIDRLDQTGCLLHEEHAILSNNYRLLRKLEHRLQIMFDLQTHTMPEDPEELRKLAIRMGFASTPHVSAREAFLTDYRQRTDRNRTILDHLLHQAFPDDEATEPEVDLVNDPDPSEERIEQVLGKYEFADVPAAYTNLLDLATEPIRFLSTRRCRHFLAAIAPRLLEEIARSPDPDATLVNLARVSDSLGGKSALWELFSSNRPSLNLYVTLCAACPYLAGILTSNPGMIDELMDSLVVEKLPTHAMLESALTELCRGAEDIEPILHSFKNSQHLRVGVRDVLGKDDIRNTHMALSDIAETCLRQIATVEYDRLVTKYGRPTICRPSASALEDPDVQQRWQRFAAREGGPCEPIILALGKLGGREPNYHSDLDIIFLYEADGNTEHERNGRGKPTTTNAHFFGELGQRIMKVANHLGPLGRLYEVDPRLRPTGRSGALAVPIDGLARYFSEGQAQLWERQALCKARAIVGSPVAAGHAMQAVNRATFRPGWRPEMAREIRDMRYRLEESATPLNLKRGRGGTVDIEFIVQMLQLRHGHENPNLRVPGTLDVLAAIEHGGHLTKDDTDYLRDRYRFQRSIEARIRLMNAAGRHEFPTEGPDLEKLAFLLGYADPQKLVREAMETFEENRRRFERIFDEAERG